MPHMSNPDTKSRDDWETPDALIAALRREFGAFGLDPCANAENKKADNWFGPGSFRCGDDGTYGQTDGSHPCEHCRPAEDGLAQPWCWDTAYVNPPYGRGVIEKWVEKCYMEVACGRMELVVALLPASTSAGWWHKWIMQATEVRLLRGRLTYKGATTAAPWDSVIVVWRKGQLGRQWFDGWDWRKELS